MGFRFILPFVIFFVWGHSASSAQPFEGPPDCSLLSAPVRAMMPIARTVVLDTGMYIGLVALWPHAFSPSVGSRPQFAESWTRPPYMNPHKVFFEADDDPWVINGVLHGIYGSEVFLASRTMGHNGAISFLYALGASITWEYLIESWFHRPSSIDLVWTPVAGAVLGELRFQLVRLIQRRVSYRVPQQLFITLLDPLGQLERLMLGCRLNCGD